MNLEFLKHLSDPKHDRRWAGLAWFMIVVAWGVMAGLVWHERVQHNDCTIYIKAPQDFWAGRGLYDKNFGIDGFLYFPQFALVYSPFAWMGNPVGDVVWRGVGIALYGLGLWRLARLYSPGRAQGVFAVMTALALPAAMGSLRNGQANLHIAGMMLQATAELLQRRWARAALWLAVGVAVKPIMLVMLLLAAAVYRPLIWRIAVGIALVAAAPFAVRNAHYVVAQYHACYRMLQISSQPPEPYCNLSGLLSKMGWVMPQPVFQALAIGAAGAALLLCLLAFWRWAEPGKAYFLLGLSAVYLMLFNPRTESSSYVALAPAIALPAALLSIILRRDTIARILTLLAVVGLTCDGWAYRQTENWLKPLTCVIFAVLLIYELFRGPRTNWPGIMQAESGRKSREDVAVEHEFAAGRNANS